MPLHRLLGVFVLVACCASGTMAQTTVRVVYPMVRNPLYGEGVEAFGSALSQLTGGRYRVAHLSRKGDEIDNLNKVKAGARDMLDASTGPLASLVPEVKVLDQPFLFTGYAHARSVLHGPRTGVDTALMEQIQSSS